MSKNRYDVGVPSGAGHEWTSFEWTQEPPTEAGLYRAIWKSDALVSWVYVQVTEGVGIPLVVMLGNDVLYGIKDFSRWLGPLPTPELPKDE